MNDATLARDEDDEEDAARPSDTAAAANALAGAHGPTITPPKKSKNDKKAKAAKASRSLYLDRAPPGTPADGRGRLIPTRPLRQKKTIPGYKTLLKNPFCTALKGVYKLVEFYKPHIYPPRSNEARSG